VSALLTFSVLACRLEKPPPTREQTEQEQIAQPGLEEPGQRVSIGAKSLHIDCAGSGSPTVVFDAGLGGGARMWEGMIADVRRQTRACRYDRLGEGRSDPASPPHSPVDMALELSEVLDASGERPPFVLVGHSLGGINARLYTQTNPRAVAGIVLVESMHEDQERRVGGLLREALQQQTAVRPNTEGLTSESLEYGLQALRQGERSLGSRPLVVLSAGVPPQALPGIDEQTRQRMWVERRMLQVELTQLSTNSVQVIAERSGHAIPRDQPQLVVNATLEVVRAVRQENGVQRERVLNGGS
jgi:pimeloyl-ACP methyl ester carboxylesterase